MINYRYIFRLFALVVIMMALVGCSSKKNEASKAIEAYINALSNQDANLISNLSCADWEASALTEVNSFTAVSSVVSDLACQESGQESNNTYVSCTGSINLDYNGEAQVIDLSARTYIARLEGGEWRMCGYR